MNHEIRHNEAEHRFEAGDPPHVAELTYRTLPGAVEMLHVEVPEHYQGQGLAGQLASTALAWARKKGIKVIPTCPYVRSYLGKHPEFNDLIGSAR
jgi:predicted GNAT family acetyltransferase